MPRHLPAFSLLLTSLLQWVNPSERSGALWGVPLALLLCFLCSVCAHGVSRGDVYRGAHCVHCEICLLSLPITHRRVDLSRSHWGLCCGPVPFSDSLRSGPRCWLSPQTFILVGYLQPPPARSRAGGPALAAGSCWG